jgi:iron complex outermembrane receptor protein
MYLKFVIIFISTFNFIYSQNLELKVKISNDEKECDDDLKQFVLLKKIANQDSIFFTFQDTSCLFSQKINLEFGNYILRIKSVNTKVNEIPFEINKNTNTTLDLGIVQISNKVAQIEEVTITGIPKKFILIDPEKTTVTVENNAVLESSTIYDAIKKIPGIIPNPSGGFTYSGQMTTVFFEGIPSSLSGVDLDNLLKGLPATTVKKIELITNPGASYDANFNGAIIDIISQDRSFKWLSGSVSLNVGINNNTKVLPSFLLNGKAKRFTWNFQSSFSNIEKNLHEKSNRTYTFLDSLMDLNSDRKEAIHNQNYTIKGNVITKISKKSVLQLNAGYHSNLNLMNGKSFVNSTNSFILPFSSDYEFKGHGFTFDGGLKYRVIMDTFNRKLEFSSNYTKNEYLSKRSISELSTKTEYSFIQSQSFSDRIIERLDLELPFKNKKSQFNFGVKLANFIANNKGSYRINDSIQQNWETTDFNSSLPFQYSEQNLAFYTEFKQRLRKSFSFTFGLRAEDFKFKGKTNNTTLIQRNFLNIYPSIHTLYRINSDMIFMLSYSRKINLPNYSMYDPNLTGYYDSYTKNSGNNNLEPNFFHRSQAKLTIFDYLQLSLTHSYAISVNLQEVFVDSSSYSVNYSYKTYNNVQTYSGFFSLPVPFGMFIEGLDFFRKPVNVDEVSFLYLYTNFDKSIIPNYTYLTKNKTQWSFGVYSQFILPLKIRLNIEYNYTSKGMIQISSATKDIHELEFILSREFLNDKWRVSATFQDVLNSNRYVYRTDFSPLSVENYSKWDTQIIWLKVAYSFGKYERPSIKEDVIPVKGS